MSRFQPDLVIFDCDGVLVDSEMLSARVLKQVMLENGLTITDEVFRNDFLGRSFSAASERFKHRVGIALPKDFQETYRQRLIMEMRENLKPMRGAETLLSHLSIPFCLATSSSPERLAVTLAVTGLQRFFSTNTFTASQVENGKPAPDLFLFAARQMKTSPIKCLVIEDSEMGVMAAHAAGMQVWHFAGGEHVLNGYRLPDSAAPDRSISDMQTLKLALAEK
jgi:HAD superfamily hydrolase (TIGR01509 family)